MRLAVGDVWDVNMPFSNDPETRKYRPAAVISWSRQSSYDDAVVVVVPITGFGGGGRPRYGDVEVLDIQQAHLNKRSWVRARRLFSADTASFDPARRGRRGTLDAGTLDEVLRVIEDLLTPP